MTLLFWKILWLLQNIFGFDFDSDSFVRKAISIVFHLIYSSVRILSYWVNLGDNVDCTITPIKTNLLLRQWFFHDTIILVLLNLFVSTKDFHFAIVYWTSELWNQFLIVLTLKKKKKEMHFHVLNFMIIYCCAYYTFL